VPPEKNALYPTAGPAPELTHRQTSLAYAPWQKGRR